MTPENTRGEMIAQIRDEMPPNLSEAARGTWFWERLVDTHLEFAALRSENTKLRKRIVYLLLRERPQGANMTESKREEEGIAADKKYRYITIRLGNERFEGKPVYRIFNNKSGGQLAILSWYKPWRTYVFSSHDGCVFNHSCLKDVIGFLEGITR